jgi:hypothetical protein
MMTITQQCFCLRTKKSHTERHTTQIDVTAVVVDEEEESLGKGMKPISDEAGEGQGTVGSVAESHLDQ